MDREFNVEHTSITCGQLIRSSAVKSRAKSGHGLQAFCSRSDYFSHLTYLPQGQLAAVNHTSQNRLNQLGKLTPRNLTAMTRQLMRPPTFAPRRADTDDRSDCSRGKSIVGSSADAHYGRGTAVPMHAQHNGLAAKRACNADAGCGVIGETSKPCHTI